MPELPDIVVYCETIAARVVGRVLTRARMLNPFVLRSVSPTLDAVAGKRVSGVRRIGKRIVLALDDDLFIVIHLMIAGRLRWLDAGRKPPGKLALASFEFDDGALVLTEAGTKRRASIHLVQGEAALAALDPGGLELLDDTTTVEAFAARLRAGNHTVKRALTDPRSFSGIGNAYSDEILHRAKLSPFRLTMKMDENETACLFDATRAVLTEWTARLLAEAKHDLPAKVTAFHPKMAVHGKFGEPCPVCGAPVQRVVFAENEMNYCARCQTGGRILADRALSQLLHDSFPKNIDDMI